MKILYLILASNEFPYFQLRENGIKTTWLTRISKDDRAIQLFSTPILGKSDTDRNNYLSEKGAKIHGNRKIESIYSQNGENWSFPTYSGWDSILHKTLSAMQYALNHYEFDFIVRTGPTNLWNPLALKQRLLSLKNSTGAYGTLRKHREISYIEGSNMIIDKKTTSILLNNVEQFNFGLVDDVAFGEVFTKLNIKMIDWPRPRIETRSDFHDLRYGDFSRVYTFRCRASIPYNQKILRKEIKILTKLHKLLLKSKNY